MIGAVFEVLAANRTRRRRARNLRAGGRARTRLPAQAAEHAGAVTDGGVRTAGPGLAARLAGALPRPRMPVLRMPVLRKPGPLAWLALAALLLAAAGAWVIATHARWLAAAGADAVSPQLAVLQPALPGIAFEVPDSAGVRLGRHGATALLVLTGMRAEPAQRIDLCAQMADPAHGRLLPVRIGWDLKALAALAATPRNPLLASAPMPRVELKGSAIGGAPLSLAWAGHPAEWIGDAGAGRPLAGARGETPFYRQGWLLWDGTGALRVLRRPSSACPQAGELVLQLYRPDPSLAPARALVAAFPAAGTPVEVRLAPGRYAVPASAPARMEDQQLFEQLRAHRLVRLGADGLAELAPPDLAGWRAAGATPWDGAVLDTEGRRLLQHLYARADGAFVREQVRIFNSERRLLAWRVRGADLQAAPAPAWRIELDGVPAPLAGDMPAAGARLFARLPQGWAPWQRVGAWPSGGSARLRLALPAAARPGDAIRVMLAGRLLGVQGGRLAAPPLPACSGRACRSPDQVQLLDLQLEPGARELVLEAAPLGMDALATPGDARYRHLGVRDGELAWQALPAAVRASVPAPALAEVRISDRNGAALWQDGAPTEAARAAGLATLLGVRADQASSVAGMLGRLPGAGRHEARLSIDLGLQAAAQAALDCIGMRRGQWLDGRCSGAGAVQEGRQAGLVVLDTETGEVLAAAGSGNGQVDAANWSEARAFERLDPAASPLRLPAFQHDGGAERSPGSTFKIVSALGLELAAQSDPGLDALLDGMPLAGINAYAAARGWDFRTGASSYPADGRARITNFRDQGLDRRAQDGRLGLAQALTYSLNTWFAWTGELSDRAAAAGTSAGAGLTDLQPLVADGLDRVRPIVAMAHRLGFGQALRLDGGLLPAGYPWSAWDALQATPAAIDPVHTRHELRQMAIGLRMQATPLQMALAAGAVGQGGAIAPRLLVGLDGRQAQPLPAQPLGVRLDRIRAGMKGVVDAGTAAGAFRGPDLAGLRRGLSGKTGTAPVGDGERATVWFTGWLEPGSIPGQAHRLAIAVFVSRSEATGGEHAAPVAAAVLRHLAASTPQSTSKARSEG
ncbi:penicillin-binding transpeptidase domain-containing protein [Massilia phyllosphaerae]|uniref:penicillin-binding transpeptidase domain-containing protein n=1 Tax=Massilia phyllosphaerae TaxID=3106034 RepID=UPI002B1CB2A9|nr:penicillin-binding transpeptidase domain-containing protein [Massilia sp. SGZ-792]